MPTTPCTGLGQSLNILGDLGIVLLGVLLFLWIPILPPWDICLFIPYGSRGSFCGNRKKQAGLELNIT